MSAQGREEFELGRIVGDGKGTWGYFGQKSANLDGCARFKGLGQPILFLNLTSQSVRNCCSDLQTIAVDRRLFPNTGQEVLALQKTGFLENEENTRWRDGNACRLEPFEAGVGEIYKCLIDDAVFIGDRDDDEAV